MARSIPYQVPILYEDNHLLVVVKPVNMPIQKDASGDMDLLTWLKLDLKQRYQKPGNVYLGLVHRLDRPVGGVVVFAKTSKAASRLSNLVRMREFHKTYWAVVHGTPQEANKELTHYLLKDHRTNTVKAVAPGIPNAKQAVLEYRLLKSAGPLSIVEIQLITGRSHQIRVQMATIGHPLYGDQKYGAQRNQPGQQIALWATAIRFVHPTTKERLVFTSRPPSEYPWNLWEMPESAK